jgi:hypothetical protein
MGVLLVTAVTAVQQLYMRIRLWRDLVSNLGIPYEYSSISGQNDGCENPVDEFYGRLSVAWDEHLSRTRDANRSGSITRAPQDTAVLQPHLDPRGTGVHVCNGSWLSDARKRTTL